MNAISKVISGLTAQNVFKNYESFPTNNVARTQEGTETNSFLSILKLLDVNADDSLDTKELKLGLEGFITNFMLERDLDEDQALNAEESGISRGSFSHLDTNSNRLVDGEEIISEAGRILEGLVSRIDTNPSRTDHL